MQHMFSRQLCSLGALASLSSHTRSHFSRVRFVLSGKGTDCFTFLRLFPCNNSPLIVTSKESDDSFASAVLVWWNQRQPFDTGSTSGCFTPKAREGS